MARQAAELPKFKNESEEADWWASAAGRNFVKRESKALRGAGARLAGSTLVKRLNKSKNARIAIELPAEDLEQARKIAGRKGVGWQSLLAALIHEGLRREGRAGREN